MKKFHNISHLKGGIDLNEDDILPNANYWKGCALAEYRKLRDLIGEEKASRTRFWKAKKYNWKEKYFKMVEKLSKMEISNEKPI